MGTEDNSPCYELGLALSGGGARGVAHAGALQAFEEAGVKPDIIAGVSAGSIAAVLYAAGVKPREMLEMFEKAKFSDFARISGRKDGLFVLDRFVKFLMPKVAPYNNIEELPLPVVIAATDFIHGTPVVFDKGDIGTHVKASCSIPIVFPPVVIDGTPYVDGGLVHNLPAWTLRDKCRRVIGINCSPIVSEQLDGGMIDIAMRTFNLLAKGNMAEDMAMCDISIELRDIAHYKVFNLKDVRNVYISGYRTARRVLRDNRHLL